MKKIYLALILALILMLSISVNAENTYIPGTKSYTNEITEGAEAVLVYKGTSESDITSENIYFIDQCDEAEGFSDLKMALKLNAPAGKYTVLTDDGSTTFEIFSDAKSLAESATQMTFLGAEPQGDSSYAVAFGISGRVLLNDAETLAMIIGDNAFATDLFGDDSIIDWGSSYIYKGTENEEVMFAIQIEGVGTDYIITGEDGTLKPNFDLYIK